MSPNRLAIGRRDEGPQPKRLASHRPITAGCRAPCAASLHAICEGCASHPSQTAKHLHPTHKHGGCPRFRFVEPGSWVSLLGVRASALPFASPKNKWALAPEADCNAVVVAGLQTRGLDPTSTHTKTTGKLRSFRATGYGPRATLFRVPHPRFARIALGVAFSLCPTKNRCHPEERLSPNRPAIGRRDEGPQPKRLASHRPITTGFPTLVL
jgi:hypothetical protein